MPAMRCQGAPFRCSGTPKPITEIFGPVMMPPYGPQFGPDFIFLGVAGCDLDDEASYADADVVILGAPFDRGTSYRAGANIEFGALWAHGQPGYGRGQPAVRPCGHHCSIGQSSGLGDPLRHCSQTSGSAGRRPMGSAATAPQRAISTDPGGRSSTPPHSPRPRSGEVRRRS